jgi:GntR family transcriptional regulator
LSLQPGEPVVELKRLFFADQQPVIYVINLIPANLLAVPVEEINGRLSIREILQLYCNENIAYALSEVCANLANSEVSSFLKLPSQTPLLNIHICFYDANNRPIVSGSSYYDDTVLKLRLVQAWQ